MLPASLLALLPPQLLPTPPLTETPLPPPPLPPLSAAPGVVVSWTRPCRRRCLLPPPPRRRRCQRRPPSLVLSLLPQPPSTEAAVNSAVADAAISFSRQTTGRCCSRCRQPHYGGGKGNCHRVIPGNFRRPSQPLPVWSITPAPATSWSTQVTYPLACGAGSVGHAPLPPLSHAAASWLLTMVYRRLTRSPRSVAEVLGTGSIPA